MSPPSDAVSARSPARGSPPAPAVFHNLIGDRWLDGASRRTFEDRNPAHREDLIGLFPRSNARDVDAAVAAAKKAFPSWSRIPAPRRGEILFRAARLLQDRKEGLAREMTREMGKVLSEARGDVQEAIDCAHHAAGEGRRLFGITTPSELRDKFAMAVRAPIGVCALISPWNFPMAIPAWKLFPALVSGNTVVFKPASDTPLSATRLVEILQQAGLPEGVVNLVHGTGTEVGEPLTRHPGVRLVSFTGSSAAGRWIAETTGRELKRCSLELGGKNAQVVLEDAHLDLAVEGALWGAFATAGQRCTATSRVIVHRDIKKRFLEAFVARVRRLVIGDGLREGVQMGPLVNEARRKAVQAYVEIGKRDGARLLLGGRPHPDGACREGWFYKPTVFDGVTPRMRIAQEEIFGPVVGLITVKDLDEAIDVMNGTPYGLSSSIYTQDVNRAFRALERFESGIVYINASTIGAEYHLPFGGVKQTGNGHREGGETVFDVFTEWKTVYVDYSGKLQKAQIDANA